MNLVEELTKPNNPFDQGARINQENFKMIRDLLIELHARLAVLEERLKEKESVYAPVEEEPKKKKK